ncbi:MAG TPA: sugar kinase [Anaerolineae bacterium]
MFDLLVIGEINPDLILRGADVTPVFGQVEKLVEDATLTIGASSVITACGAARLGLQVAFIGLVGDDLFGHFMMEAMQARGIDTAACVINSRVKTGLGVILVRPGGDRAILTYPGSIAALRPEHVDRSLLARARHLHVGSTFLLDGLRDDLPTLLATAHAQGLTTSVDTNWDPREQWDAGDLLAHCDLFLPNETEAQRISGRPNLDEALAALGHQVPTLAVKMGEAGGLARQGDKEVRQQPLPVQVVDTVGAGDSFNAGFLYGYLHDWSLEQSLRLAVACGSLSTRAGGGTAAQPTLNEALSAGSGQ